MPEMRDNLPGCVTCQGKRRVLGLKNAKLTKKKDSQPNETNWLKYRGPDLKKVACYQCGHLMCVDGPRYAGLAIALNWKNKGD
jgi:hypothetical protein